MKIIQQILLNRIGWICVLADYILLIFGIYQKGFGQRRFHFYHEPWPIKLFCLLNLPVIIVAELISSAVLPPQPYEYFMPVDNFTFFLSVFLSTLQWLAIGWWISSVLQSKTGAGK